MNIQDIEQHKYWSSVIFTAMAALFSGIHHCNKHHKRIVHEKLHDFTFKIAAIAQWRHDRFGTRHSDISFFAVSHFSMRKI